MTANSDWLARYHARKNSHQPPPPPVPQPAPQQPYPPPAAAYNVPGYPPPQMPQPPYVQPHQVYPQPVPGAPQHAPFGYDQATGVPISPYGRDQFGNILVQPPQQYYAQPPGYPQPPPYDPRGQVAPPVVPGYPPYGQPPIPGQPYLHPAAPGQPAPEQTLFRDDQGQVHVDWATAPLAYQGGRGTASAQPCPQCRTGFLIPTDATPEAMKLNTTTGVRAAPAPHCNACGYNGIMTPGETSGAIAGAAGGGIKVKGQPVLAPGAGSLAQTANQHGLPNLFAPVD